MIQQLKTETKENRNIVVIKSILPSGLTHYYVSDGVNKASVLAETKEEAIDKFLKQYTGNNSNNDEDFINQINRFAVVPINYSVANKRWLHEQLEQHKDNEIWKHLSNDQSSLKHFKIKEERMSKEEGIFMVDIDFLIRKKGNVTGTLGKEISIREGIKQGVKFDVPQFFLRDDNLGEGNHRVMVMKELGYKSVPVAIYWKL